VALFKKSPNKKGYNNHKEKVKPLVPEILKGGPGEEPDNISQMLWKESIKNSIKKKEGEGTLGSLFREEAWSG